MRSHDLFLLTIVDLELAIFNVPRHQVQITISKPVRRFRQSGKLTLSTRTFLNIVVMFDLCWYTFLQYTVNILSKHCSQRRGQLLQLRLPTTLLWLARREDPLRLCNYKQKPAAVCKSYRSARKVCSLHLSVDASRWQSIVNIDGCCWMSMHLGKGITSNSKWMVWQWFHGLIDSLRRTSACDPTAGWTWQEGQQVCRGILRRNTLLRVLRPCYYWNMYLHHHLDALFMPLDE